MSLSLKPFSIIYNLISRGTKTVLCDFSHYTGNFQQITIKMLEYVKKFFPLYREFPTNNNKDVRIC